MWASVAPELGPWQNIRKDVLPPPWHPEIWVLSYAILRTGSEGDWLALSARPTSPALLLP